VIRIWKGWGEQWSYRGPRTWLQQRRYEALIKDGLRPYQAKHFVFYNFSHAYMRRFRAAIRRKEAGRSQASVWDLWRRIYDDAIRKGRRGDRGGYEPPPRKYDPSRPHKKLNQDGTIDYSHTRDYERNRRAKKKRTTTRKAPSGNVNIWIRELEQTRDATTDPTRRAQLNEQIRRLRQR